MPALRGVFAKGTTLKICGTTVCAGVTDFEVDFGEVEDEEDTELSTTGDYKTYQPGWIEPGVATFKIFYSDVEATHKALVTALQGKTVANSTIAFPGTKTIVFPGYVKSFKTTGQVKGYMTASVSVKVSGLPTPPTTYVP